MIGVSGYGSKYKECGKIYTQCKTKYNIIFSPVTFWVMWLWISRVGWYTREILKPNIMKLIYFRPCDKSVVCTHKNWNSWFILYDKDNHFLWNCCKHKQKCTKNEEKIHLWGPMCRHSNISKIMYYNEENTGIVN